MTGPTDPPTQDSFVLVGCGSAKQSGNDLYAAADLYTSGYFSLKQDVGELAGDWGILSAKHGLISPSRRIRPYDKSMDDLTDEEKEAWAEGVANELGHEVDPDEYEEIVVLAGQSYIEPIRDVLESHPVPVRYPFADTTGIGPQNSLLSRMKEEGKPGLEDIYSMAAGENR